MSTDGLEIRPAGVSAGQLNAYSELLSRVFGASSKFTPEAIAWRYRDNPAGEVVGADAWAGETLAAHYVTCPMTAEVEGRTLTGLLSLNTATHPDFQGRGLFTRLAQATYEDGAARGYAFVIGVANAQSTPGFLRKLGFQHVAPLEAGVLTHTPRRFAAAPVAFAGAWTPEMLAWRLLNPAADYRASRHGELTAVWADTHLPGIRCVAFLAGPPPETLHARPLGLSLYLGLDPRLNLGRLGLVRLPERLRPSPLNLIYRPLGEAAPRQLDARAVALNFLDFDPY
ncbi:MAG: GNAT family N-acetyltransferase [Phenylobacterium sp.]|uniref:GNAT family N-acetyltransferase n=1 Tax=Phenylobacterium sp. TaxID=1871053 RepID=UPI00391C8596